MSRLVKGIKTGTDRLSEPRAGSGGDDQIRLTRREIKRLMDKIVQTLKKLARARTWARKDFREFGQKLIREDESRSQRLFEEGYYLYDGRNPKSLAAWDAVVGFPNGNGRHYRKEKYSDHYSKRHNIDRLHAALGHLDVDFKEAPRYDQDEATWPPYLESIRRALQGQLDKSKGASSYDGVSRTRTDSSAILCNTVGLRNQHVLALLSQYFSSVPRSQDKDILCSGLVAGDGVEARFDTVAFYFHIETWNDRYGFSMPKKRLLELIALSDRNCVTLIFCSAIDSRQLFYVPVSRLIRLRRVLEQLRRSESVAFLAEDVELASFGQGFLDSMKQDAERVLRRRLEQGVGLVGKTRRISIVAPLDLVMTSPSLVSAFTVPAKAVEAVPSIGVPEIEAIIRNVAVNRTASTDGSAIEQHFVDLGRRFSPAPAQDRFLQGQLIKFLISAENGQRFKFPEFAASNTGFYRVVATKFQRETVEVLKRNLELSVDKTSVMYASVMATTLMHSNDASIVNEAADIIASIVEKHSTSRDYELHRETMKAIIDSGTGDRGLALSFIRRNAGSSNEKAFLAKYDWLRNLSSNLDRKIHQYTAKDFNALEWHKEMAHALLGANRFGQSLPGGLH